MNEREIADRVIAALAEAVPGVRLDDLDPARPFRDQVDVDSIDYLAFVLAIERGFGLRVPELDYPKLSSLAGAVAYLRAATA